MNAHRGLSVHPKEPNKFMPADMPTREIAHQGNDLNVGDTYKGLPIISVTKELYVCRHKLGYTECFQKKDRALI